MTKKEALQLFEEKKVRTAWDDNEEKWYFSIVDVVAILTDQVDTEHARNYWKVLKHRLKNEGNETVTNCNRLKLRAADGKSRMTDVADAEHTSPHYNRPLTTVIPNLTGESHDRTNL